ncbi:MAG TPA: HAMP domain-containing histidine kinase [Gammaproteobacteria bacterium]|nr:HAMP domain-containing histidine kinase [Gammaproteobacteria bacterium]
MVIFPELFEQKNSQAHSLYRLFVLRNVLILAFFVLFNYLSYNNRSFPALYIEVILGSHLVFNAFTGWWLYNKKTVTDNTLIWQLVADLGAFTSVLYLTGGASNPFGWFYLVPIFIAATLLPGRSVWIITGLSIAAYTLLMFFYLPDTRGFGEHMQHIEEHMRHNEHFHQDISGPGFHQHIISMWLGFLVTALLVAYVVTRMADSIRERDQHLAQARENALRDERLVALGTLAAGTAHELGTPLSTIAVIIKEMQFTSESEQNMEYLGIIRKQVERCKTALAMISHSAGEELMSGGKMLPVREYIANIIAQWQQQRPSTKLVLTSDLESIDSQILAEQTMTQALINILNNAADASPQEISLQVEEQGGQVIISVMDSGQGLDSMIQTHAGKHTYSSKKHGLGLGLFLAHASIERLGGEILLTNREQGGATVKILLPLTQREAGEHNDS